MISAAAPLKAKGQISAMVTTAFGGTANLKGRGTLQAAPMLAFGFPVANLQSVAAVVPVFSGRHIAAFFD